MNLSDSFLQVRNHSLYLCRNLITEDYSLQASEEVSPPKWHLAHTTWFFEQFILVPNDPSYVVKHPQFNFLFNSYYNSLGARTARNQRGLMSRPSVEEVYIKDFAISSALVTNEEYLEFIEAGGYENPTYWHDEGWAWAKELEVKAPLYWVRQNGAWFYYTLDGLHPFYPSAAVSHVNFYEASAYAAWKGLRLPTEFEWEIAQSQFDWGKRWEWTNSAYLAYPGFQVAPGAIGEYNGKFMINQMVLRGASVATSEGHSRPTYRNFFHPKYRWQFMGIRLAKSL